VGAEVEEWVGAGVTSDVLGLGREEGSREVCDSQEGSDSRWCWGAHGCRCCGRVRHSEPVAVDDGVTGGKPTPVSSPKEVCGELEPEEEGDLRGEREATDEREDGEREGDAEWE
jgi:hypothetical protein